MVTYSSILAWKCLWSESCSVVSTLSDPMNCIIHEILQARTLEWVAFPFSRESLPNPRTEPRSPALQADFLPAEPQGKPKKIGVVAYPFSKLSSQPRNQTLHCRWILNQLSYQGSPLYLYLKFYHDFNMQAESNLPYKWTCSTGHILGISVTKEFQTVVKNF